ncbi:MAG: hypothetical protein KDA25_05050 [Phycisphaerales bacterium]|nr:hypothetical protein [Phycisphaerales bacterium]
MAILLIAHLVSTLMLGGLIWFVQIVHYPLFATVGRDAFVDYERRHVDRTTWVVAPLMLVEVVTAALAVVVVAPGIARVLAIIGLAALGVIWGSTAMIQVPCHRRLERGYDDAAARRLVVTNWIRTVSWTIRVPIAIALLRLEMSP